MFCIPKTVVLRSETGSFATQNSRFRNAKTQLSLFKRIIFTKLKERLHETWIK